MLSLKERMGLTRQASDLKSQIKGGQLPIGERIQKTRELADTIKKIKGTDPENQAEEQPQSRQKNRARIGQGVPNVSVTKQGPVHVFEREGYDFPITVKMAPNKDHVTINIKDREFVIAQEGSDVIKGKETGSLQILPVSKAVFGLSEKYIKVDSYVAMISSTNTLVDAGFQNQVNHERITAELKQSFEEEREIEKAKGAAGKIERLQQERELVLDAQKAFDEIEERELDGKDATPAQLARVRAALNEYPPAVAVPEFYRDNIWRYKGKIQDHLSFIDEGMAKAQSQLDGESQSTSIIDRYKAGDFNTSAPAEFVEVMRDVHSEGLTLNEVKQGALAWFEANPDKMTTAA